MPNNVIYRDRKCVVTKCRDENRDIWAMAIDCFGNPRVTIELQWPPEERDALALIAAYPSLVGKVMQSKAEQIIEEIEGIKSKRRKKGAQALAEWEEENA